MPINSALTRHAETYSESFLDPSFLTPPLSPINSYDVPFIPGESDTTSLNMRRHGKERQDRSRFRSRRAYVSSGDVDPILPDSEERGLWVGRSHSMPSLPDWQRKTASNEEPVERNDTNTSNGTPAKKWRARRWTLPSKASSTRGAPSFVHVEKQKQNKIKSTSRSDQSPAMITLRRASTGKSPRRTSITFFPPPKFNNRKKGFLFSLLNSTIGSNESIRNDENHANGQDNLAHVSQYPVVGSDRVCPTTMEIATTVCTELVDVDSRLSHANNNLYEFQSRRCSTRYVSRNSVYEIIWDESGTSSHSSEGQSKAPSRPERRPSAAVDRLEMQLSQAVEQSRRHSLQVQMHKDELDMKDSENLRTRRSSFRSQVNFAFSRLFNENALQGLPRSRMSKTLQLTPSITSDVVTSQDSAPDSMRTPPASTCDLYFFPPLRSRTTTNTSESPADVQTSGACCNAESFAKPKEHPSTLVEFSVPSKQRDPTGSHMGASRHVRRKSMDPKSMAQSRQNSGISTVSVLPIDHLSHRRWATNARPHPAPRNDVKQIDKRMPYTVEGAKY